jgi:Lar family restriction alleviation protein
VNAIILKPCPFCGGEAAIEQIGDRRQSAIVVCQDCGCRRESGAEGEAQTAESWNRRVPVVTVERLEVLRQSIRSLFGCGPECREGVSLALETVEEFISEETAGNQ